MTSTDYIHASAHLNTMVFEHPERRRKEPTLEAAQQTDVQASGWRYGSGRMHAMRPQFAVRVDIGGMQVISQRVQQNVGIKNLGLDVHH